MERLDAVKLQPIDRDEAAGTRLLKEHRKWAVNFELKFKAKEALAVGFSDEVISLTQRESDLGRNE